MYKITYYPHLFSLNRNKTFYQIQIITMKKNYDESVAINYNQNWPYIPDYPYRILNIGFSGSGKTNVLFNFMKHQRSDIDKIYIYVKDPIEPMYQLLFNGREKIGVENLKNPKECIDY